MRIQLLIMAIAGLILLKGQAVSEPLLDLTVPGPPEDQTESVFSVTLGGSFHPVTSFASPPLQMTLAGLEPGEYRLGARLVFEVVIENDGGEPFAVLWGGETDRPRIEADRQDRDSADAYPSGLLTLAFDDVEGRQGFFFGRPMYGSRTVPGTLRDLLPGKWVRIRSSAELSLRMLELTLAQLPIEVELRAQWSVFRHPDEKRYLPLLSSNSVRITVAPYSAAP